MMKIPDLVSGIFVFRKTFRNESNRKPRYFIASAGFSRTIVVPSHCSRAE